MKKQNRIQGRKWKPVFLLLALLAIAALVAWWVDVARIAKEFDWNRDDVSEIEITKTETGWSIHETRRTTFVINDREIIDEVFDGLSLRAQNERHFVGGSSRWYGWYEIRLRRKSDGDFSEYAVDFWPEAKPTGDVETDIYIASIYGSIQASPRFIFGAKKLVTRIEELESTSSEK